MAGFLTQRGVARERVRVGFETTAAGNVFADDGGQFVRAGLGIKAVVEQPLEKGDIKGVELVLPRVERTVLKRWMR